VAQVHRTRSLITTRGQKCSVNSVPLDREARSGDRGRQTFPSAFDKASILVAEKAVLSRPLEEADRRGSAGVQGFNSSLHWNPDCPLRMGSQFGRDAPALAADRKRDVASQVAVEQRRRSAWRASCQGHVEGRSQSGEIHVLAYLE